MHVSVCALHPCIIWAQFYLSVLALLESLTTLFSLNMVTSDSEEPSGSFQNTNAETSDSRNQQGLAGKMDWYLHCAFLFNFNI